MASKTSSAVSLPKTANYLPSSREAFLERLETFGPITRWHVPSTEEISAAAWAKRGWWCIDTDLVACKACNEELLVQLGQVEEDAATEAAEQDEEGEGDDLDTAAMLRHRLLVEKYRDMIITSHAQSCPWRNRGCDESIQRQIIIDHKMIDRCLCSARPALAASWCPLAVQHFSVPTANSNFSFTGTPHTALSWFPFSTSGSHQILICFRCPDRLSLVL